MAKKWKSSGTRGVRYYEHETRKHGIKKDRYYAIRFTVDGKQIEEGMGWASQGMTEEKAVIERSKLIEARLRGDGPRTLSEKRALHDRKRALQRAEGLTLADFWEQDYVHALKARIKQSSWEKEVDHYTKRILPAMGHKPIKTITPADVDKMLDRMREDKLTPRTQQYAVGTLYRIWKHAAKRKLVKAGDNPAIGITLQKVNNARLRVLTPQELKSILDYLGVTDTAAHDITMFCAFTGCRFSEAGKLTWEHVDLKRGMATFTDTKNKDVRAVYLVPVVSEMMERRGVGGPGEHVFTMKDGSLFIRPPHPFRTAVKNLELNKCRGARDKVSFHSLRHTAATLAARRGTPVKDLQILFGWRTPSMVFRYAKGDEDTQRRAMSGLAQSLVPEQGKVIEMVKKG